MGEYCNIVGSKWWETIDIKENTQDETLPLRVYTGAIQESVIKTTHKYGLKSLHSGKYNDSGGESSTKSFVTYHKCVKTERI